MKQSLLCVDSSLPLLLGSQSIPPLSGRVACASDRLLLNPPLLLNTQVHALSLSYLRFAFHIQWPGLVQCREPWLRVLINHV